MFRFICLLIIAIAIASQETVEANDPPEGTTMSDRDIQYNRSSSGYTVVARGPVEMIVVDNRAIDNDTIPGHRSGYSGIASLKHLQQPFNFFVPSFAGLNFEHIHDGTIHDRDVLFEPRMSPMELRVVDEWTVELYQQPTPNWHLESCHRYRILEDGTIEVTFECIPRRDVFEHGFVGLFWASYVHQPGELELHLRGHEHFQNGMPVDEVHWIKCHSPEHGINSTHLLKNDNRSFEHDMQFPLSLVFNQSAIRVAEPWCFGVSRRGEVPMALVMMFRERDQIRITQSPSGGGKGNPAWDFQYFIPQYEVDKRYQFVMRVLLVPYESHAQIERVSLPHRRALNTE